MYKFEFILREVRISKGITQKRLAFMSGISQSHISEIELGKQSPSLQTIEDLTNALKVHPHLLIKILCPDE